MRDFRLFTQVLQGGVGVRIRNLAALAGVVGASMALVPAAGAEPFHVLIDHKYAQPAVDGAVRGDRGRRLLRPGAVRAGLRPESAVPRRAGRRRQDDRDRRCLRLSDDPERPGHLRLPDRAACAALVQDHRPDGPIPAYDGSTDQGGWALESSLDVEYAHAIAPGANILLVETTRSTRPRGTAGFPQIVQAEKRRDRQPSRGTSSARASARPSRRSPAACRSTRCAAPTSTPRPTG